MSEPDAGFWIAAGYGLVMGLCLGLAIGWRLWKGNDNEYT